jgi:sulfite exporter TauE/SafE
MTRPAMSWPLFAIGMLWAFALIGALTYSVTPELKQTRFSLRTLLILTTLIAVVMGLAILASR